MTEQTTTKEPRTDTDLLNYFAGEGWKLVKVDPETKGGVDLKWQKHAAPLSAIRRYVNEGGGVGVQVGEASGWLAVADADHEYAVATAPAFLPETLRQAKGDEISHYFLYCEGLGYEQFNDLQGHRLVDIKASNNGAGHLAVLEPTRHPTKGQYRFVGGFNPAAIAHVPLEEAQRTMRLWACSALIAAHLPKTREEGEGGRHDISNALAGFGYRNGWTEEETLKVLTEAWKARKAPEKALKSLARNVSDTVQKIDRGEPATGGRTLEELIPGLAARIAKYMKWERVDRRERLAYHLTDMGNAERFIDQHGDMIRYCYEWSSWLVFDGVRWAVDVGGGRVRKLAKATVRAIYREAADTPDEATRKAIAKHAASSESASKIEAMLKLAECEVPIRPEQLDFNPYLLNCLNGTINLRTGVLRDHDRVDYLTKLAPVEFVPDSAAPVWQATLERILPAPEIRDFFKRLCGYAMTGDTSEHVLPMLYGTGANGKSTVLNALQEMLGDYGMQAAPDLLIAKRNSHPTERADLFGARFVASIEVEDGRRLAESLVKQLTGGDRIRARRMREDFWEFAPTHKVFMAVNHKPIVRGTDNAIWRRIRLIPFTETIPPAEQDKQLSTKLEGERSGILAWALEGCLEWQREGLQAPDEVRKATGQYRAEMDVIGAFLKECCLQGEEQNEAVSDLYKGYKTWCVEGGETYETQRKFGQRLKERGFEQYRGGSDGGHRWRYVSLLTFWKHRICRDSDVSDTKLTINGSTTSSRGEIGNFTSETSETSVEASPRPARETGMQQLCEHNVTVGCRCSLCPDGVAVPTEEVS